MYLIQYKRQGECSSHLENLNWAELQSIQIKQRSLLSSQKISAAAAVRAEHDLASPKLNLKVSN